MYRAINRKTGEVLIHRSLELLQEACEFQAWLFNYPVEDWEIERGA